jgi:V8-like Glu-specific endopeptidase
MNTDDPAADTSDRAMPASQPARSEETLEQLVDRIGFVDPEFFRARMADHERAVCLVTVGGSPRGTGFMIAQSLVCTCYHVVATAIDPMMPSGLTESIRLRFDYRGRAKHVEVEVARLEAYSATQSLDYAILRVAADAPTIATRTWIHPPTSDASTALHEDDPLLILQHPRGGTIALAMGTTVGVTARDVRYRVNTEPGSSGSPCFNARLELVAIHRNADGNINRGYRIAAIQKDLAGRPEILEALRRPPRRPLRPAAKVAAGVAVFGVAVLLGRALWPYAPTPDAPEEGATPPLAVTRPEIPPSEASAPTKPAPHTPEPVEPVEPVKRVNPVPRPEPEPPRPIPPAPQPTPCGFVSFPDPSQELTRPCVPAGTLMWEALGVHEQQRVPHCKGKLVQRCASS